MTGLTLLDGIDRLPPPYDGERLAALLADLSARAAAADAATAEVIGAVTGDATGTALLAAIFGNSPFLSRTLLQELDFFAALLAGAPDAVFEGVLSEALEPAGDDNSLMVRLRRAKAHAALLIAIVDIAGLWPLEQVTDALTRFADTVVQAALRHLLRRAADKGELALADEEAPERGSGLAIIAMGKYGAHELNYSSDIDFLVLFDQDVVPYTGKDAPQSCFVRLTQMLVKVLQERTADGYVFRTDLRLRPDPSVTPAALSMLAAETYYESMGQNWERAAMIKARAAVGDVAAGAAFLARLQPFIWRKHLDFAAIEDVHSIKRQIEAHKGHGRIAVEGHNIKVGRGGIRDIEFFAQTQQLIAGGRDPGLRQATTCGALAALVDVGWISRAVLDDLVPAYRFHRTLEHRLQMVADEQTQTLPRTGDGIAHMAAFMGYHEAPAFRADLLRHLECVQAHCGALFEGEPALSETGNLMFTGADDDAETAETLKMLGFERPEQVSAAVRAWHHGRYRATRSARTRELLTKLIPMLLRALGNTAAPDAAFARFDRFLQGLPAGVQLFSLLQANPGFLDLFADIMGSAPRLANYLSQNAAVMDAVLSEDFFDPMPPRDELARSLDGGLALARGFEDVLDIARRFVKERKFQLGVQLLSGSGDAETTGPAYADLADAVIDRMLPRVIDEFAVRHGRVGGAEMVVLALGKLGGREMSATSDLDLIFIYDFDSAVEQSDGERPLGPAHYFTRLSQRFLNALTVPTAEGELYEVDMRLRPSGSAGPVATRFEGFIAYHEEHAWTWEHMALTRARVVSGPGTLRLSMETAIWEVLCRPREVKSLARDVAAMRARIAGEKGTDDPWEMKQVRGGLVDLEFIAQFLQLANAAVIPQVLHANTMVAFDRLAAAGCLDPAQADDLRATTRLLRNLTAVLRIAVEDSFDPATAPIGLKAALVRAGGVDDFVTLEARLVETEARALQLFNEIVERAAGD